MSEIGDRIRRLFDEAASPVDLERIVQHHQARSPFFLRRAVAYTTVGLVLVAVTVVLATLVSDGDQTSGTSTSIAVAQPDDTSADTTNTTEPAEIPTVPLVPLSQWPDAVLAPFLDLPACSEITYLPSFIAEEFPAASGSLLEAMASFDLAAMVAVPRFGAFSIFPTKLLDGACLESGQMGDVWGWALVSSDGTLVAQAAAQPYELSGVPDDLIAANYHQSRIASRHTFSASVDADGRTWGLVNHDWYILDSHAYLPGGDLYFAGERLASSLWIRPSVDEDPRYNEQPPGLFDPVGLPEGYGLCAGPKLEFELSAEEDAEWFSTMFCTAASEYLELLEGIGEGLPPIPANAEGATFGTLMGSSWTANDRLNVAVDIANATTFRERWLWITGPTDLDAVTLRSVLLSTLILQPEVQNGRKADVVLPEGIDYEMLLLEIVSAAGSQDAAVNLNTFADQGQSLAAQALAMGANRVEPLESADAVIRQDEDLFQVIASCGGLYFNAAFHNSSTEPKQPWTRESHDRFLAMFDKFLREVGCVPDSGVIPQEVLDYWALDGTLGSVAQEPGWLCPFRGPYGYGLDLDPSDVPSDLKRVLPGREPIEVGSGDSGPECGQPHLLVLLDPPDATLAANSAGMTIWPQIGRPGDVCPPENCTFDGPVVDLTLNGEPARLQRLADAGIYMVWWVDASGTPMYAESSGLSEDRIVEITRGIDVDPMTHRATVASEVLGGLSVVSDQASLGVWVRKLAAGATYVIDGVNVGVSLDYDFAFDPIAEFAASSTLELVTVNDAAAIWIPAHGNFLMYTDSPGVRVVVEGPRTVGEAVVIAELLVRG